jgi:hypothetical protein
MKLIKAKHVTPDQGKLLKEKGFDIAVKSEWIHNTTEPLDDEFYIRHWGCEHNFNSLENHSNTSAPEQWQVVEWLRVEKGIWVNVEPCMSIQSDWRTLIEGTFSFMFSIRYATEKLYLEFHEKSMLFEKGFNSPEEAYSAAFDYILNKLI